MVYNAMKLFMEVNPQLFDECSHDYTEQQNNAASVKQTRQAKWDRLAQLAESMKAANGGGGGANGGAVRPPADYGAGRNGARVTSPAAGAEPQQQDSSSRRMEQLRLQDDRERRPKEYERHSNP
ncbi:serine/threonine-protein phosphatase 2A 56 kDa regulatory subunit delta isoform, partial [Teratosphaeriaceae sp. CCFEE 6253]